MEELPAELEREEEDGEGGSFLEPGGELQREPRGDTETPESQLSFRLRLPPPRPGVIVIIRATI